MAKKKFNISSTLKKNTPEEVELAPKVPLKKTAKDPEEIKSKVEEIHAEEVKETRGPEPVQEQVVEEPNPPATKATSRKTTKATQPIEKQRIVRMTIDTPEDMHLQLKIKSIQSRMSMRDYVLRLIEKDLKKG